MKKIILLILAILLIIAGVNNGDPKKTQIKGSIICLECIGIG